MQLVFDDERTNDAPRLVFDDEQTKPFTDPVKPEQSWRDVISEFGVDVGKRIGGALVGGVASMPLGAEKGIKAAVRSAVTGGAETVMPSSVFMPGLDTDEAVFGPETGRDKLARGIAGERAASAVPSIPFSQAISDLGGKARESIQGSASQATRDAVAKSQITGNLFKGEMDFGKDPSVRGFVMQAADVFGSMLPVVATALITKNPNAGAVVGGSMAAGEGANSAQDFIAKKTDVELQAQSPFFAKMIEAGASPAEARKLTVDRASESAAALQGLVASFGDRFTGKLVTGQLDGLITKAAGKSAASKVVAGGALSATEEGVQEVAEGVASDVGMSSVVPSKEIGEDSAANFVLGALGGGPAGAGRGAYSAWENRTPAPVAPVGSPVDSVDLQANTSIATAATAQAATNSIASTPDTSAAEAALLTPVTLTALDRVNEIDSELGTVRERLAVLTADASGSSAVGQELLDATAQSAALEQERSALSKDWPKSVPGVASSFTTEAGARVEAQYALMDAADLITSHDEGLRKNPLYPPELQPRERERAASEIQVAAINQKLDPARLGWSADAATGAPIVGADGLVESGNARTIALKRVYQIEDGKGDDGRGSKAHLYREFLKDNAAQFGITPEAVDGMAKPVLVRVRSTPVNRAEFARQANASTVAAMAPSEQAKSDANRIDSMVDLSPDDNGDFSNAASRPFIMRFMARLPQTERAGMQDANGNLSTTGYARVRNAVLAKAYGDSPVLARMTESMDDNLRNVSRAFMLAAPKVAVMHEAIREGARFDADITPDLMSASEELARLKIDGGSVADALAQTDIMGDQRTPEASQLLQFLSDNMRRPRRMADFIGAYMDALDAAGDPNQGSLLGETQAPTKQDLLKAAERAITNETTNPGTTTQDAAPPAGSQVGQEPGNAPGGGRSAEGNGADANTATQGSAGQASQPVSGDWVEFAPDSGAMGIPRAKMPQVKVDKRPALYDFLMAKGITHTRSFVKPGALKPTQAEYSPAKAENAKALDGQKAVVLASSDGYILDGHHRWVSRADLGEMVDVIKFSAPMGKLLEAVREFPGVTTSSESAQAPVTPEAAAPNEPPAARAEYVALAKEALGELAAIASKHTRMMMLPEDTPGLMPALVKLFSAAIKIAGSDMKAATKWVKAQLKADPRLQSFWQLISNDTYQKAALQAFENPVAPDQSEMFEKPVAGEDQSSLFGESAGSEPSTTEAVNGSENPDENKPTAPVITAQAAIEKVAEPVKEKESVARDTASAGPRADSAKIEDIGEKIGGARKDTAVSTGARVARAKEEDDRPTWAKRFTISQIAGGFDISRNGVDLKGKWAISDTRNKDRYDQPKRMGDYFVSKEDAESALPLLALAQKHRVTSTAKGADGEYRYEIWRDISDRKRVKVVDKVFDTRTEAMEYMAKNAQAILETSTTFGEADLPKPESTSRTGVERRTGDVKGEDFQAAFGFRGVEFGNWNNQDERQEVMNAAYDGLMDLAEVLGVPPKAIGLNGDLALAFGARGQGLNSARAHYERNRAVMNLTKMNGAGALAHEWFHALDHYLGRQDGKASAEWKINPDGTRSFDVKGAEADMASGGFRMRNSGVREVLRDAYAKLVQSLFYKAEQYVDDTAKADKFVATARGELEKQLAELRKDLSEQKDVRYYKRSNKPASAEQLAEFDALAAEFVEGRGLATEWKSFPGKTRMSIQSRHTNDALEKMSEIYKAVRGRSGFDATNHNGVMDTVRQYITRYEQRLKLLADANSETSKTKNVPTNFAMDAKSMDQGRGTDYWTTPHEMVARAFQGYVEDMIAARGGKSPFLNYAPENSGVLTPWGMKRPYPSGDERKAMNAEFDNFVGAIQTRETNQGVAMFSRSAGVDVSDPRTGVSEALLELGKLDSLYQYPRSEKTDLEGIAADKSMTIGDVDRNTSDGKLWMIANTTPDDAPGVQSWIVTLPGGEHATLTNKHGEVYINVSAVGEGNGGSRVYDLAANYAFNNGLKFIGDPNGVSSAAMRRRLENMLSAAIKYGSTDFLAPHADQIEGNESIGVPALKWTDGDTLGNIRSMVDVSVASTKSTSPIGASLEFHPSSSTFQDGSGNEISGIEAFRAYAGFDGRGRGTGAAGRTTLQRNALFKSLLQSEGARRALLESVHRQQDSGSPDAGGALEGIFYSKGNGASSGLSPQSVQDITDAIKSRWSNAPYIVVAANMADAAIPQAVRDYDQQQKSLGATGEPEGFTHKGKVYLVADQLATPSDVIRVLFHESLGHIGLRGAFGNSMKPILQQIVAARKAEVAAKASHYGLDMGKEADRLVAAEEVLAEMAQTKPELGFVKRAVAAIRNWLRANVPGFQSMKMTDADIIEQFILPARAFVERGKNGAKSGVTALSRGEVIDQTDTPAFKKWFGDSKVVDGNGLPLVVYHGTRRTFNAFSPSKPRGAPGNPEGIYFTADKSAAEEYAQDVDGASDEKSRVVAAYIKIENAADGQIIDSAYRGREYIVFKPENVKSATDNTGNFDGTDPDIRFSRNSLGQTPAPIDPKDASPLQKAKAKALSLTSPQALDQLMYDYTDKYIDLKRIRDHIKAIGGTITDLNDAYLGEELYHKRLSKRTEDFLSSEVQPLLADLRARGVGTEAFEEFLHARHAPEANKAMAARNPTQAEIDTGKASAEAVVKALEVQLQGAKTRGAATLAIEKSLVLAREEGYKWVGAQAFKGTEEERLSLSGMTDAKAQAVMDGLTPAQLKNMNALAARVDAINAKTMDTLGQYGLMDQESLGEWRKAYQFYIPLHRDEAHPDSTSHPIGQGFSVKGDAAKRRTGSNAKVSNILGHIAMQREAALTRGEKNTVVKKLYVMAAQNPDADLWSVEGVPTITQIDKKSGFAHTYPDPMYKNKPNVVMVRIAGKDAAIVFNERNPQGVRLAGAMKNIDVGDLGAILTQTARVTRLFSAVNTQWNPIFGLVNFARDIQAAMLNLSTTPLSGQQAKVAKGVPSALRAVYRVERGKTPSSAEGAKWAALWEDLQEVGGTTGYRDMYSDASDRMTALLKDLQKLDRGQVSQAAHAVVDWLSDYNDAIENGVRLSAYSAALDQGMSRERAASLAKNLTVNFNRKGAKAREIGALYAFFNAAIQGNARMFETLRGPVGKKIMFGGVALGMITSMLGMAVMGGGDGEDDEWAGIPEFVKERAIVIPLGHQDYMAIPLPLGFHVFPNFGRLLAEWAMGGPDKSLGKQVGKVLGSLVDSFNPVGGGSDIGQVVMPTVMDPLLALWRNKDWTGRPIYREDGNSMDPTPGFTRAKDSASTPGKLFAELINWISGGNEYRPGAWSPTPDQLDYVVGQVTGGLGRELLKVNQVITTPFTGDELPAYKVPVLGRFYGNTRGSGAQSGAFYENVRELNEVENEVKGRNKNDDDADAYMASEPLTNLIGDGNSQEKIVSNLRKQRKQEMRDEEPGYKDRVKEINTQIEEEMRVLNRAVARVKSGAAVE